MQRIFDAGCGAQEYVEKGRHFLFPELSGDLCPHCGKDLLRKHGFYSRYLVLRDFCEAILIRRYICKQCGHTVSLLPSFAHPGRSYGIGLILRFLTAFYTEKMKSGKAADQGVCSRQLLRWFRIRLEKNINMLIIGLVEAFKLRAPPVKATHILMRVAEFFEYIRSYNAEDISLKIFEQNRISYLSPLSG
jgi:hypothetical protein